MNLSNSTSSYYSHYPSSIDRYVLVADSQESESTEIIAEDDGTLTVSSIASQYPGATGLKYNLDDHVNAVKISDGKLFPPEGGWSNHVYYCIFSKDTLKRKAAIDELETPGFKVSKIDSNSSCVHTDLAVLGLPWRTTDKELRDYFSKFGELQLAQVKIDSSSKKSKGYGLIRFADQEVQVRVLLQRHQINGRWCDVQIPVSKADMPVRQTDKSDSGTGDSGEEFDVPCRLDADDNTDQEDAGPGTSLSIVPNSNRMMRNMAEKMRRDKLNAFITELAKLVPMVSNSPKRMDKTSVLRLTATYIRQKQLPDLVKNEPTEILQLLRNIDWSQLLEQELDNVMIITTAAGKIVYITDNIEKLLGHTQVELFGQSIFNITCPKDYDELKKCLTPDGPADGGDAEDADESGVTSFESPTNSNCSSRPCASRCNSNKTATKGGSSLLQPTNSNSSPSSSSASLTFSAKMDREKQKRSLFLRLRQRCLARSEEPQYELVHFTGHLWVPKKLINQAHKKSRKHKEDIRTTNSNEILLIGVMKPFRERRVTMTSLLEANRDEYVSRHSADGCILYCDHRISMITGHLFKEVKNLGAFSFMHKDDVRWVMIALRRMFCRGESFGSSCYRLQTKNNEYIYLKTYGYLEYDENMEPCPSFICINTWLSDEEGKREAEKMKSRYSALIESSSDPGIVEIAKNHLMSFNESNQNQRMNTTEDPSELKRAIRAMITNVPTPTTVYEDPQKSREAPFIKAKLMSKALPPMPQSTTNIASLMVEKPETSPSACSSSVSSPPASESSRKPLAVTTMLSPSSVACSSISSVSQPSTPSSITPTSPLLCSSRTEQNRPSVLRHAPPLSSRQPVTIYNGVDEHTTMNSSSTSSGTVSDSDRDATVDFFALGTSRQQKLEDFLTDCVRADGLVKQETLESSLSDSLSSPFVKQECAEVTLAGLSRDDSSPEDNSRVGVVVRRTAAKRHYVFEETSAFPAIRCKKSAELPPPSISDQIAFRGVSAATVVTTATTTQSRSLNHIPLSNVRSNGTVSTHDGLVVQSIDDCGVELPFADLDHVFERKPEPEIFQHLSDSAEEELKHSHIQLNSRMHHLQGAHITDIEGALRKVPFAGDRCCLQANLATIKEQQHQEKILMSLRPDHYNMQHCNTDSMNVSNIHSNVGV